MVGYSIRNFVNLESLGNKFYLSVDCNARFLLMAFIRVFVSFFLSVDVIVFVFAKQLFRVVSLVET